MTKNFVIPKKNTYFVDYFYNTTKNYSIMEQLKSYLGVILLLLGVVMLVVYKYMGTSSNFLLWGSLAVMVAGLITYILINRKK
jgi:membrane protein YdbS with pleckstrin-like domain